MGFRSPGDPRGQSGPVCRCQKCEVREARKFSTQGVFLFVGLTPRTEFLKRQIELDQGGYIINNANCETSVEGVFAAGDCTKRLLRQIATAVGDGATAAFAAEKYLEGKA